MTNLVNAIIETYTNPTELYIRTNNTDRFAGADGWKQIDTLQFHAERKLKREIQDLEFWIPKQADREATSKQWAQRYRTQFNGDEISTLNLESSIASYKAEAFALAVMQSELTAAQVALKELTGGTYTSIKDKPDAELPAEIASIFAEMDAIEASNTKPKKKGAA
jgi:hypothetical protein